MASSIKDSPRRSYAENARRNAERSRAMYGHLPRAKSPSSKTSTSHDPGEKIDLLTFIARLRQAEEEAELKQLKEETLPNQDVPHNLPDCHLSADGISNFLTDMGWMTNLGEQHIPEIGKRQKKMKLFFERHGNSTHNNWDTSIPGEIDTVLTMKGWKEVISTGYQVLDDIASGILPKFDMIVSSPLIRCLMTSAPIDQHINSITHDASGKELNKTYMGILAAAREFNRGTASCFAAGRKWDPTSELQKAFLNYKNFSGREDTNLGPNGQYILETKRQGEERVENMFGANGDVIRLMAMAMDRKGMSEISALFESHAEWDHESHRLLHGDDVNINQGWTLDNGYPNAAIKGVELTVEMDGAADSDDFTSKVVNCEFIRDHQYAPKVADVTGNSILSTPWENKYALSTPPGDTVVSQDINKTIYDVADSRIHADTYMPEDQKGQLAMLRANMQAAQRRRADARVSSANTSSLNTTEAPGSTSAASTSETTGSTIPLIAEQVARINRMRAEIRARQSLAQIPSTLQTGLDSTNADMSTFESTMANAISAF